MAGFSELKPLLVDTCAGSAESPDSDAQVTGLRTPKRLLTPAHVAKRFAVSERTIRYWAEIGELPGFKIGNGNKLWRFDAQAIEDYLTSREASGMSDDDGGQQPGEKLSAASANSATAEYTFHNSRSQSASTTGKSAILKRRIKEGT
jgi:excisionase family DNA binding protein